MMNTAEYKQNRAKFLYITRRVRKETIRYYVIALTSLNK